MKARDQVVMGDGFDRVVAEKMPSIKRAEESLSALPQREPQPLEEERAAGEQEKRVAPPEVDKRTPFTSKREPEPESQRDVLKLIEDLHAQLLVSGRTQRALEMDLGSAQRTIRQLSQDNQDLRVQLDHLKKEIQRHQETQSESVYLREENEDALARVHELQQELRNTTEALAKMTGERDEAFRRIRDLESEGEHVDVLRIRERLREKEASHFSDENRDLQARLEETLAQNAEIERKYEALRRSFHDVKESLTVLRDSCKMSYYRTPEGAEP